VTHACSCAVVGTLALVVAVMTIIATSVCVSNFGKGLKEHCTWRPIHTRVCVCVCVCV
jgi:hypothetical protein